MAEPSRPTALMVSPIFQLWDWLRLGLKATRSFTGDSSAACNPVFALLGLSRIYKETRTDQQDLPSFAF